MSCAHLMDNEPCMGPQKLYVTVFLRLSKNATALSAKIIELLCVNKGNKIWTTLAEREGN